MKKMTTQAYTFTQNYRAMLVSGILCGCFLLSLFYAFTVYRAVSLAVAMQHVNADIRAVDTNVGMLEAQYIAISRTITPDSLVVHGFSKGTVTGYVPRVSPSHGVAFVGYEL
jgi:hypothetical protein